MEFEPAGIASERQCPEVLAGKGYFRSLSYHHLPYSAVLAAA
ncbi:hypothetical protein OSJ75_17625 [Phyllobacterium sp. 0TCS1.6A]|nr:hypothetical protein [Phyllobacterium sp. 0TCS1.6A]